MVDRRKGDAGRGQVDRQDENEAAVKAKRQWLGKGAGGRERGRRRGGKRKAHAESERHAELHKARGAAWSERARSTTGLRRRTQCRKAVYASSEG